jgi:prevent-host-death family protein
VIKVNISEAKNRLSELIRRALAGEEVIICKRGKPLVRLVPYHLKPHTSAAKTKA